MPAVMQIHFDPLGNPQLYVMLLRSVEFLDHLRPPGNSVLLSSLYQQRPWTDQAHDVTVGELRQPAAKECVLFLRIEKATVSRVRNHHLVPPVIEPGRHDTAFDSRF